MNLKSNTSFYYRAPLDAFRFRVFFLLIHQGPIAVGNQTTFAHCRYNNIYWTRSPFVDLPVSQIVQFYQNIQVEVSAQHF